MCKPFRFYLICIKRHRLTCSARGDDGDYAGLKSWSETTQKSKMKKIIVKFDVMSMRKTSWHWAFGIVMLTVSTFTAKAQRIGDGLWNTGRAFRPVPTAADSLVLQKQLTTIDLYLGFAVVRNELDFLNPGTDTINNILIWRNSLTTPHVLFNQIGNSPSLARKLILHKKDTVALDALIRFAPGVTHLTTYEITPNQQGILVKEGNTREANAFVYTIPLSTYKKTGVQQVFVQLKAGLTMTNVLGIEPSGEAQVTMSQVKWQPTATGGDLVIWYEGAAPDMKLEKKVLPAQDGLYQELNAFDLMMFDSPAFKSPPKPDFSTNKKSPLLSALYFILFSLPWVLLVGFLAWLAFKPKKKKTS